MAIVGTHTILYSAHADDVRALLARVLGTNTVDAGGGWTIIGLPPGEVAAHPADDGGTHELYLVCDDLSATMDELREHGVTFDDEPSDEGWGVLVTARLAPDLTVGLYEPRHPTAF